MFRPGEARFAPHRGGGADQAEDDEELPGPGLRVSRGHAVPRRASSARRRACADPARASARACSRLPRPAHRHGCRPATAPNDPERIRHGPGEPVEALVDGLRQGSWLPYFCTYVVEDLLARVALLHEPCELDAHLLGLAAGALRDAAGGRTCRTCRRSRSRARARAATSARRPLSRPRRAAHAPHAGTPPTRAAASSSSVVVVVPRGHRLGHLDRRDRERALRQQRDQRAERQNAEAGPDPVDQRVHDHVERRALLLGIEAGQHHVQVVRRTTGGSPPRWSAPRCACCRTTWPARSARVPCRPGTRSSSP